MLYPLSYGGIGPDRLASESRAGAGRGWARGSQSVSLESVPFQGLRKHWSRSWAWVSLRLPLCSLAARPRVRPSWHIDPRTLDFPDFTIQVCDGLPSYVEDRTVTSPDYCPWSAKVIKIDR